MTPETRLPYCGYYINLNRSEARRAHMDAQLDRLGLKERYTRFAAVDGNALKPARSSLRPGEVGAFLSHRGVLEAAKQCGKAIHVLEDDAVLSSCAGSVIESAVAGGLLERFDVVFTDTLFSPHLGMLKGLKSVFNHARAARVEELQFADLQVIDLTQQNFSCMTSYVVGPRSIDKILSLYRAECDSGPSKPVDIFLRDCVHAGRLRAAVLFPFITSFDLGEIAGSTIANDAPAKTPSVMVLAVLRNLYFVERDLVLAKACLDRATTLNRKTQSAHHDMIVQALEFIVSDDFQEF